MTPIFSFQSPISGSGYSIDRYRLVNDDFVQEIDAETRIEFVNREFIDPFKIAKKSGTGEIIDVVNKTDDEISFSLRVSSNPISPFQINFDRNTLKTFGITPVDPMSSNLTTIFDLLADISDQSSIEYLLPFVKHELHFVRWRAIRSIYSIDENVGLQLIQKALLDSHEHVRAAAASTMAQIST
ncbi:HEAT repeat domain-containing protein [Sphingorhabdus sp.]|uniref:HEAT repeat domain-containing protein n=1 Tax=Sphingorhabdus sp. TaxID=1902408 RepID=UPI003918CCDA